MKKSYSEKIAEFQKLGPFIFVDAVQFHAGDETIKPPCALCNTRCAYHFTIIATRNGENCYIGDNCRRHIKIQYHPQGEEHHGNT